MNKGGVGRFGSGWVWLVEAGGKLSSRARQSGQPDDGRQEARLRHRRVGTRVHLKYLNRRPDYLAAWWNVIKLDEIRSA
jgi:Fe-Mn family superoxide dismutase